MWKKCAFGLLLLILSSSLSPAGAADASINPEDGWVTPDETRVGTLGVEFSDQKANLPASYMIYDVHGDRTIDPTCASINDAKCQNVPVGFQSVIPVCNSNEEVNCIAGLEAIDLAGNRIPAAFNRYFPSIALNAFAGNEKLGIPNGASSSIWTIPGAEHRGGSNYLLNVVVSGRYTPGRARADISSFEINLSPEQILDRFDGSECVLIYRGLGPCDRTGYQNFNYYDPSKSPNWVASAPGPDGVHTCLSTDRISDRLLCAQKYAFPRNSRFKVMVRTSILPTGWLHGRLLDPSIQIVSNKNSSTIEVEASPIVIPAIYVAEYWKDFSPARQSKYDAESSYLCSDGGIIGAGNRTPPIDGLHEVTDPNQRIRTSEPSASGQCSMELLKSWIPTLQDKATGSNSIWSLRTLTGKEKEGMNACFEDASSVTGIVTTNSTTYLAGPPIFNQTDGTLSYKVASPHYLSDGTVFKGTYDLVMRSDVARCIYRFSSAPLSAKIEIVSEDGSQQVATTSVSEKDGWLHLAASGFTYSSPTLKVKLEQAQSAAPIGPVVPAAPTPVASTPVTETSVGVSKTIPRVAPIQKSITCVKGKSIKKVTAVNPKCPVGYKKRSY